MTIQELRFGNDTSEGIVIGMIGTTVWLEGKNGPTLLDEVSGIPLTEEWLVKFGFEKVYESNYRVKYDYMRDFRFGYDINRAFKNCPEGVSFRGDHYTNIKHVHQLQNLYFALTGEELTLKTE